jgi:hypothetical protein
MGYPNIKKLNAQFKALGLFESIDMYFEIFGSLLHNLHILDLFCESTDNEEVKEICNDYNSNYLTFIRSTDIIKRKICEETYYKTPNDNGLVTYLKSGYNNKAEELFMYESTLGERNNQGEGIFNFIEYWKKTCNVLENELNKIMALFSTTINETPIDPPTNQPQQNTPQNNNEEQVILRQFTNEQIEILKTYFTAQFKGMGNNINYFEHLLIDLKKDREGVEYAKIAKLIYESRKSVAGFKTKPFTQWYETFCNLMGIRKCQYRISRIIIDDIIRREFYYL